MWRDYTALNVTRFFSIFAPKLQGAKMGHLHFLLLPVA